MISNTTVFSERFCSGARHCLVKFMCLETLGKGIIREQDGYGCFVQSSQEMFTTCLKQECSERHMSHGYLSPLRGRGRENGNHD